MVINMMMTIVEAKVKEENWAKLKEVYKKATDNLPTGLIKTFLIQNVNEKLIWRIVSVWQNREALEKMRNSGETPGAILVFRAAEAEPEVSIFEVALNKEVI